MVIHKLQPVARSLHPAAINLAAQNSQLLLQYAKLFPYLGKRLYSFIQMMLFVAR
jgi:hypothetical protein